MVPQHHRHVTQKGDPTLLDNYPPIALMNNLLKLWTVLLKDTSSKHVETHHILSEQQNGFRLLRNIDDIIMKTLKSTTRTPT
jgi:hypothetical protein